MGFCMCLSSVTLEVNEGDTLSVRVSGVDRRGKLKLTLANDA